MSTSARYWREIPQRYRYEAAKCKGCGAVWFPPRLICSECGKKDFEDVILPGTGKVKTSFSREVPSAKPEDLLGAGSAISYTGNVADLKVDWFLDLPRDVGLVSTPLVIDTNDLDFVKNPEDLALIKERIRSSLEYGTYQAPLPGVGPEAILQELETGANRLEAFQQLHASLDAENRQVVLFVEEAQGMPLETLEEIAEHLTDERAVELVFGKPKAELSGPGLHFHFWPIETVEKVQIVGLRF